MLGIREKVADYSVHYLSSFQIMTTTRDSSTLLSTVYSVVRFLGATSVHLRRCSASSGGYNNKQALTDELQ